MNRTVSILFFAIVFASSFAFSTTTNSSQKTRAIPTKQKQSAKRKLIDFKRDVWPILAENCFECHGPETREGKLRLDSREMTFAGGLHGPAFKKGKSGQSLIVKRISSTDVEKRMPQDSPALSKKEIATIARWIDEGAIWPDGIGVQGLQPGKHWSYIKPIRPKLPEVKNPGWCRNPVDYFIQKKLERTGFKPSREADKARLIRRVTLDLIGLPPTLKEIDRFLKDDSPNAYDKIVDRLLKSPQYGERWAVPWLDAARYADSNGYQRDGKRVYWAYRDWVIRALNDDMPFDRFTVEQIAGDLLPGRTFSQLVATGFHRGTMANVEAGTDPEDQRVQAIFDRVNTTGTVWLGTTLQCARCHDHKYDPFSQKDYYRLFAFFNNTEKEISSKGSERDFVGPKVPLPLSEEQNTEKKRLENRIVSIEKQRQQRSTILKKRQFIWEKSIASSSHKDEWKLFGVNELSATGGTILLRQKDGAVLATGKKPGTDTYEQIAEIVEGEITGLKLEILTDESLPQGGPGRAKPGNFILSEIDVAIASQETPQSFQPVKLALARSEYSQPKWPVKNAIDGKPKTGWAIGKKFGQPHRAEFFFEKPLQLKGASRMRVRLVQKYGRARTIGRYRISFTSKPANRVAIPRKIVRIVKTEPSSRTAKQKRQLEKFYLSGDGVYAKCLEDIATCRTSLKAIAPVTTLVMKELPTQRKTRVFKRGDFLKPGKEVRPGTPRILHTLQKVEKPTRLDFARWLVAPENPLVARVTVNRIWAELMGQGIVSTVEDFGTQGERPTHPQLLDWLATEFLRQKWSMKSIVRTIVTSATYRQSSKFDAEKMRRDPYNKLYARGSRTRLKAEFVRDNALVVSGLLSPKMYGPPVFPYQPPGVWNHIGRTSNLWKSSKSADKFRRGVYVNWRRTVPYPSFTNFDAPTREACVVKRSVSNTPLQALTLLNDPAYFEMAKAFAGRIVNETPTGSSVKQKVAYGFRLATSRPPNGAEIVILANRFHAELKNYHADSKKADKVLQKWKIPQGVSREEFAAWVHVANVLLNLDETITK